MVAEGFDGGEAHLPAIVLEERTKELGEVLVSQRADDVDEAAAKQAMEEARRALTNQSSEVNYSAAAAMLAEAAAQLRAIEALRKKMGK